jgi:hypothetical protein
MRRSETEFGATLRTDWASGRLFAPRRPDVYSRARFQAERSDVWPTDDRPGKFGTQSSSSLLNSAARLALRKSVRVFQILSVTCQRRLCDRTCDSIHPDFSNVPGTERIALQKSR